MPYVLGVDVGRTRVAAAVCRRAGAGFERAEVVPLDRGARWTEAVLAISEAGELLVGSAATQADPHYVARDFLPRVGDDVPVLLGGELYPAETLAAAVVTWVVDVVTEAEGAPPERLAVTHPPEWGSYRRGLFRSALHASGLPDVLLLPTVVAAAEAAHAHAPVRTGTAIAVSLVGGRSVEHAVLTRSDAWFQLMTHHSTPDADAGDHLDTAMAVLTGAPTTPARHAKEHLSHASETSLGQEVVTRTAFEAAARPTLAAIAADVAHVIAPFRDAAPPLLPTPADEQGDLTHTAVIGPLPLDGAAADLVRSAADADRATPVVTCVALAGGTATIALLSTLVAESVDVPVTVLPDPATAPARGAALAACPRPAPPRFAAPGANLTADASHPGFRHPTPAQPEAVGVVAQDKGEGMIEGSGPVRERVDLPPPRPPVDITPLDPPSRRFTLRPRRPVESDL